MYSKLSSSFPAVAVFLLFIFLVLRIIIKKTKTKPLNLPPSPWKLPIIGNLHQLMSPLLHQNLTDLAAKYGPLMLLQLGEVTTIIVSSAEVAREMMKTHDLVLAQRPPGHTVDIISYGYSGVGFTPYGESWRQFKKICTLELLSVKRVQSFQSLREKEVRSAMGPLLWGLNSPINMAEFFLSISSSITSKAAFSTECKDEHAFLKAVSYLAQLAGGVNLGDVFPSAKWLHLVSGFESELRKNHEKVDVLLQKIIDEHIARRKTREVSDDDDRQNGPADDDLVDVLVRFMDEGTLGIPLTTTNIKAIILEIFNGGSGGTAVTMEWAMAELMNNPRVMKKVQAEVREAFDLTGRVDGSQPSLDQLTYLRSVVKETLRLHPPGTLIPRETRSHCNVRGYDVPSGSKIIVNLWAIGRDPKYWIESEKFNPERFLDDQIDYKDDHFEFIPFGSGRRICAGISYALNMVHFVLASLLYHFDWELPDKTSSLDMTEKFGFNVARKNPLLVIPLPRRRLQ